MILIPIVIEKYKNQVYFFNFNIKYDINPTVNFLIGGHQEQTVLTGSKIIEDNFSGKCVHSVGDFSTKDPSKIDLSASYAMRYISKNLLSSG